MRRVLVLAAVVVTALLLETTLLSSLRIAGVQPDLLLLAVVGVAMASGPEQAAIFGFGAGLAGDLVLGGPVGVWALVYTVVGYGVGIVRVLVTSRSAWVPMALIAGSSVLAAWAAGAATHLFGASGLGWGTVGRSGPLFAAYNLLLTPFVYPLVRVVAAKVHSEKVYRW
jgi:rod shape-determining protein MreD